MLLSAEREAGGSVPSALHTAATMTTSIEHPTLRPGDTHTQPGIGTALEQRGHL